MTSRPVSPSPFAPNNRPISRLSTRSFISSIGPTRVSIIESDGGILISKLNDRADSVLGSATNEVEIPVRDAVRPTSRASSRRSMALSVASSRMSLRSGHSHEQRRSMFRTLSRVSRSSLASHRDIKGKGKLEDEVELDEDALESEIEVDYDRYLKSLSGLRARQRRSWLLNKAKEEVGLRVLPKPNLPTNRSAPPQYPLHDPYARPTSSLSSHPPRPVSSFSHYSEDCRANRGRGRRVSNGTSISYSGTSVGHYPPNRFQSSSRSFYDDNSRHGHGSNASSSSHGNAKYGRSPTSLSHHGVPPPSPAMSPSSFHGIYSGSRFPRSSRGSNFRLDNIDDPDKEEYLRTFATPAVTDEEGSYSDHQFTRRVRFPDESVTEGVSFSDDTILQDNSLTVKASNNEEADGETPRLQQQGFQSLEGRRTPEVDISDEKSKEIPKSSGRETIRPTSIMDYLRSAAERKSPWKIESEYPDLRTEEREEERNFKKQDDGFVKRPKWLNSRSSLRLFGNLHQRSLSSLHTQPHSTPLDYQIHNRSQSHNITENAKPSRHRTNNSVDDPILQAVMKKTIEKRKQEDQERKAKATLNRSQSSRRGPLEFIQRMARRGRSSVDSSTSTAATFANTSGGDTTLVEAPSMLPSSRRQSTDNVADNLNSSTVTNAVKRRSRQLSGLFFPMLQTNEPSTEENRSPEDPDEWVHVSVQDVDPASPDVTFETGDEELWLFTGKAAESVKQLKEIVRASILPESVGTANGTRRKRWRRVVSGDIRIDDSELPKPSQPIDQPQIEVEI